MAWPMAAGWPWSGQAAADARTRQGDLARQAARRTAVFSRGRLAAQAEQARVEAAGHDRATWQARTDAGRHDNTATHHAGTAARLRTQAGALPGETGDQTAHRLHHATLDQLHDSLATLRTEVDQMQAETSHRDRLSPHERGLEEGARLLAALHARTPATPAPSYGPTPDDLTPQPGRHIPPPGLRPGPRGPRL